MAILSSCCWKVFKPFKMAKLLTWRPEIARNPLPSQIVIRKADRTLIWHRMLILSFNSSWNEIKCKHIRSGELKKFAPIGHTSKNRRNFRPILLHDSVFSLRDLIFSQNCQEIPESRNQDCNWISLWTEAVWDDYGRLGHYMECLFTFCWACLSRHWGTQRWPRSLQTKR